MEKNISILVVDDDEFLRSAMLDILEPHYQVSTADCGKTAFEIVQSVPIDLVLSDVCMANGTGVELLEWIRSRDKTNPKVVLVTGYSQITPEEAIAKGAHSVISKPFGSKLLLDSVKSILGTVA
jgi:DNA-binding NtrC family response regulator